MLQALHDKTSGLLAKIVLALLIFVFSFFGIESYMVSRTETFVAKVGSHEITQQDFRSRFDEYRQRMQRAMGANADLAMLESPLQKRKLLDGMIDEELLLQANEKLGVAVSSQRVSDEIRRTPAFQTDGKFDETQYRSILAAVRKSPIGYRDEVRRDIELRELPTQLGSTGFVTDLDLDTYLRMRDQTRDFHYVKLEKPGKDEAKIEDADVEAYYKAHQTDFSNPEKVAVEYIELDAAKMASDAKADDATLKSLYEERKAKNRLGTPEQRLVSHILVKVPANADAAAQKTALDEATAIAKQVKGGADFAKLAKEKSTDLGSKAQGGDLGWMEKAQTDPAFESALFAMKKGDISDPVLSSEGYHIIQLRDVREEKIRSFDEIKSELAKEYHDSENERVYNEAASRLTDQVLANPASLEPAATALGVKVQRTGLFARTGGEGIAANPAVQKAAYSDAVLVAGNASDAVELGPNHIVLIRVVEHQATTPKALTEVADQVRARIVAEHIAAQAKKRAEELIARLEKGESLDALASELKTKVNEAKGIARTAVDLDSHVVTAAFQMPRPESGKAATRMVSLGNDSYALIKLDAVTDGDPAKTDSAARESVRAQLVQGQAYGSVRGLLDNLRKQTKIEVAEDRM